MSILSIDCFSTDRASFLPLPVRTLDLGHVYSAQSLACHAISLSVLPPSEEHRCLGHGVAAARL